jgi:DNA repair protein RadD
VISKDLHAVDTAEIARSQIALRPYQAEAVDRVRGAYASGAKSVVLVAPTGSGKTVCFAYVIAGAVKLGRRVLVLTHRQEIIDQIKAALALVGAPYGLIAPGCPETDAPVQIASIATLARPGRLERWRDNFDFIVVDEAHHAVSPTWALVLASQPRAKVLGVTATPERLDGRGLREQFDKMVVGPSTAELIAGGWLSGFVVYEPIAGGPDLSGARIRAGDYATEDLREAMGGVVIQSAVDQYQRICPGVPTLVFCVTIDHSKDTAERFRQHGMRALHIDAETPTAERRAAIAALGSGNLDVITNCNLFGEGVDVPNIGAVLLLRPTASLALHLQQIGRALRPGPAKVAKILDFSGNCARHGLPDEPRTWSLDAKPRRQGPERAEGARLRRCPACTALNRPSAHACANCGADLRTQKERRELEVALRLAQQRETEEMIRAMLYRERLIWAGADEHRLHLVERICGYRRGWSWHRLRELAGLRNTAMGSR